MSEPLIFDNRTGQLKPSKNRERSRERASLAYPMGGVNASPLASRFRLCCSWVSGTIILVLCEAETPINMGGDINEKSINAITIVVVGTTAPSASFFLMFNISTNTTTLRLLLLFLCCLLLLSLPLLYCSPVSLHPLYSRF